MSSIERTQRSGCEKSRRRWAIPVLVAAVTLSAACSSESENGVQPPPPQTLVLDVSDVEFAIAAGAAIPAERVVGITGSNGGELPGLAASIEYDAGGGDDWLVVEIVATTDGQKLRIRPTRLDLVPGRHEASVSVSSTAAPSPVVLDASIEVAEPPLGAANLVLVQGMQPLVVAAPASNVEIPELVVLNAGNSAAEAFPIEVLISSDTTRSSDDASIEWIEMPSLGPGLSVRTTPRPTDIPDLADGQYHLIVTVDPDESVVEADREDNTILSRLQIESPVADLYALDIEVDGLGTAWRSPSDALLVPGSEVQLSARANQGHVFVEWSGDVVGSQNPLSVQVDRDLEVTANFEPAAPELSAQVGGRRLELSWTYEWPCPTPTRSGCATHPQGDYEVEESRSPDSGFKNVFTTPITAATTIQHTRSPAPGTYFYRVRAVAGRSGSPWSAVLAVEIPEHDDLAAPSDLTVRVDYDRMDIEWTDNSTAETGFRVEFSPTPDFSSVQFSEVGANQTSFTRFDPRAPSTWYYRVEALGTNGVSGDGTVVRADTEPRYGSVRIVNRSPLPITSVQIGDLERLGTGRIETLQTRTFRVEVGSHEYSLDASFGGTLLQSYSGQVDVVGGVIETIEIGSLLTVAERLLNGNDTQAWDAPFPDMAGFPRTATYEFDRDGTYTLQIPGFEVSSGIWRQSSRPDGFSAGNRVMELGKAGFWMPDGPPTAPALFFSRR